MRIRRRAPVTAHRKTAAFSTIGDPKQIGCHGCHRRLRLRLPPGALRRIVGVAQQVLERRRWIGRFPATLVRDPTNLARRSPCV